MFFLPEYVQKKCIAFFAKMCKLDNLPIHLFYLHVNIELKIAQFSQKVNEEFLNMLEDIKLKKYFSKKNG